MEIVLATASIALLVAGLFLWGRGLLKSCKSDLILGFCVLALFSVAAVAVSGSSGIFSELGALALVFGVETLILSAFAKQDCPISRKERIAVGVGTVIAGVLSSMIV